MKILIGFLKVILTHIYRHHRCLFVEIVMRRKAGIGRILVYSAMSGICKTFVQETSVTALISGYIVQIEVTGSQEGRD